MSNPRFARVLQAQAIQELLYLAATRLLDGERNKSAAQEFRDRLNREPIGLSHAGVVAAVLHADLDVADRQGLTPGERSAYETRKNCVPLDVDAIRNKGPAKWADSMTGWLLGHGAHWFGEAVIGSPWPPGQRLRYQPLDKLKASMKRHPGRFSPYTRHERLFLRLPASARSAIEHAVRDAFDKEEGEVSAMLHDQIAADLCKCC